MNNNYYRITAYHPEKNISVIMDSYGMFEKLWQFSAFLVKKGFDIVEVGKAEKFGDGNIPKTSFDDKRIFLRACCIGKPQKENNVINVNGKKYTVQ